MITAISAMIAAVAASNAAIISSRSRNENSESHKDSSEYYDNLSIKNMYNIKNYYTDRQLNHILKQLRRQGLYIAGAYALPVIEGEYIPYYDNRFIVKSFGLDKFYVSKIVYDHGSIKFDKLQELL